MSRPFNTHLRVLAELKKAPAFVVEIAEALKLKEDTADDNLRRLYNSGKVARCRYHHGAGRPRYLYMLLEHEPKGVSENVYPAK